MPTLTTLGERARALPVADLVPGDTLREEPHEGSRRLAQGDPKRLLGTMKDRLAESR